MKKSILLGMFLSFAFMSVQAQSNVIKANPITLAFGNFNATYEKVLNESSSFLIGGRYTYKIFGVSVNLGGLTVGYRYYITHNKKPVPAGFYVQPQAGVGFGGDILRLSLGAEIGYQWVWDSGFVLDLGIGPQYYNFRYNGDDDLFADDDIGGGVLPSATLAIGFAF